jgi:hypothetical protein
VLAAVDMLMDVTLTVTRFEVPVIFMELPKIEAALRVVIFAVDRLEVPSTFKVETPRTEDTFRLVMFVVARFDLPETFRDALKKEEAFRVDTLVEARFEVPVTFMDEALSAKDTFMVAMLLVERFEVPETFRAGPEIDAEFRVVTFAVNRLDATLTFIVVAKRLAAFITRALPLV